MGHDMRTGLTKSFVATSMVAMEMGVDHEGNRLARDLCDGGFDFIGQGRELIINNDRPVFADAKADISTGSLEHIDVFAYFGFFYLYSGKITLCFG